MWSIVRNHVVVDGKLKRTEAFETGRLLAEDPEGFVRARAKGLKSAWRGFYLYVMGFATVSVILLFIMDLVFFLSLPVVLTAFLIQEWLSIRAWRSLDHGKRVYERGVETYLVSGWWILRYFVPYNEIKEWRKEGHTIHIKASKRMLAWAMDAEEVGEEGLAILVSILEGSYKAEVEPPKLVLYPS